MSLLIGCSGDNCYLVAADEGAFVGSVDPEVRAGTLTAHHLGSSYLSGVMSSASHRSAHPTLLFTAQSPSNLFWRDWSSLGVWRSELLITLPHPRAAVISSTFQTLISLLTFD